MTRNAPCASSNEQRTAGLSRTLIDTFQIGSRRNTVCSGYVHVDAESVVSRAGAETNARCTMNNAQGSKKTDHEQGSMSHEP